MAHNNETERTQEWRKRIQTSMLLNRLQDNALGKLPIEMTPGQIASAKVLLAKAVPDLRSVELMGEGGGNVIVEVVKYQLEDMRDITTT